MATQRRTTAAEVAEAAAVTAAIKDGAEAQVETSHNGTTTVAYNQTMAEITMARRLYDIWQTAGGLGSDPKWDWNRQSDKAKNAWILVARAASPMVLLKHWAADDLASVQHG